MMADFIPFSPVFVPRRKTNEKFWCNQLTVRRFTNHQATP
jgi:hypothetical protein